MLREQFFYRCQIDSGAGSETGGECNKSHFAVIRGLLRIGGGKRGGSRVISYWLKKICNFLVGA